MMDAGHYEEAIALMATGYHTDDISDRHSVGLRSDERSKYLGTAQKDNVM